MKNLIICRSMFCPKCFEKNHPKKGDSFIVYGSSSELFYYKICHHDVNRKHIGITPHLIYFTEPLVVSGNQMRISVSCGVCEVNFYNKEGTPFISFKEVRHLTISLDDFKALLMKWVRSGYELI